MKRTKLGTRLAALLLTVAVAAGLASCAEDDTLAVCSSIPFEPFQFRDSWHDNVVVGFDVDVMDLVAEELGLTQRIVETPFPRIASGEALDNGDCEVAASAISITEEREESMDFSDPYYDSDLGLAVGVESDVKDVEDLDGAVLAVREDTTGAAYAYDHQDEYGYDIEEFNEVDLMREAVLFDDDVDAALHDVPVWLEEVQAGTMTIMERFRTGEQYGYAVSAGNEELLNVINRVLKEAKADGAFAEIYEEWIGEPYPGDA